MHRCLQIPEIVHLIVGAVREEEHSTLAALARTCRFFEGPALDVLWEAPGIAAPSYILQCFPRELNLSAMAVSETELFTLPRAISSEDWDRPRRYCARVKHYTLDLFSDPRHAEMLQRLCVWIPDAHLFPNLTSLTFRALTSEPLDAGVLHVFRHLLSPRLEGLQLISASTSWIPCVPDIIRRRLPLADLVVDCIPLAVSDDGPAAVSAISSFVRSYQNLRTASLSAIDYAGLLHLAQFPNLRSLQLGLPMAVVIDTPVETDASLFPALQDLEIFDAGLPATAMVLSMLSAAPIETLHISTASAFTTDDAAKLFKSLGERVGATFLHVFSFDAGVGFDLEISPPMIYALHRFPNLTQIYLRRSCFTADVDDSFIDIFATGMPLLTSLQLRGAEEDRSGFTLYALITLALRCPALEYIDMTFDTNIVPPLPRTPAGERLQQCTLSALSVGYSRITRAFPVARFLSALFPSLQSIGRDWVERIDEEEATEELREEVKMYGRWNEVEELIPDLVQIREECASQSVVSSSSSSVPS